MAALVPLLHAADSRQPESKTAPPIAIRSRRRTRLVIPFGRAGAAAAALLNSSQGAYDAVLASFKQGLSTYTEVVTNETKLTSARNALFETQSATYQAATALAYAIGELGTEKGNSYIGHRK